jgi:mRNA interferase MazF
VSYVPARGDAIWLDFSPQSGREQAGRRPALVLTPKTFNSKTFAVCCPITSKAKGYPFEVMLPAGLPIVGVILVNQVRSLDWGARNAELICTVPQKTITDVLTMVRLFL